MMIKKRYLIIISAIVSALLGCLIYDNITLADRTRETSLVEVTNFPVDEQGNLKIRIADEEPLPEHLIFSAVALSLANITYHPYRSYEFLLLHSMVYPSVPSFTYWHGSGDYQRVFNKTFIQETYTQDSYSIQGEIFVYVHFVINFPLGEGKAWFRGLASIDKVAKNGTKVNIASWDIAERGNLDYGDTRHLAYEGALTRFIEEPVAVLEGERLALGLSVDYKSEPASHFAIHFPSIRIPIIQES